MSETRIENIHNKESRKEPSVMFETNAMRFTTPSLLQKKKILRKKRIFTCSITAPLSTLDESMVFGFDLFPESGFVRIVIMFVVESQIFSLISNGVHCRAMFTGRNLLTLWIWFRFFVLSAIFCYEICFVLWTRMRTQNVATITLFYSITHALVLYVLITRTPRTRAITNATIQRPSWWAILLNARWDVCLCCVQCYTLPQLIETQCLYFVYFLYLANVTLVFRISFRKKTDFHNIDWWFTTF